MIAPQHAPSAAGSPRSILFFLTVGLLAGATIALQICIMRIFAVGSWSHFGSLVVSLAMLGFGLASAIMCAASRWFERHWFGAATTALFMFGPLAVAANLIAQQVPFNPIFIVADPEQKWRLAANFALYLLPFVAGAFFLGTVFLASRSAFGRVYFADLVGAGLSGLVFLGGMFLLEPDNLIGIPLLLWAASAVFWCTAFRRWRSLGLAGVLILASLGAHFSLPPALGIPKLAESDYKGVAYARKFPDAKRVYEGISPFGKLEIYSSSYLHFAPGLSDNAAFNLPEVPEDAYLGLYIDGDRLFPLSTALLPLSRQAGPEDLRRPVRRRDLDRGGVAERVREGHGRRRQPRPARRVSRR